MNWHHELLASKLEGVDNGTIKRLMVFMPPRHGKSELCSIQFPAWAMGRNKDRNIIQASYSADLAHDFGRQTRNLVDSQEFKRVFPKVSLSEDSQSKGKWNTNGRGAYNAVGVGGAITGKGADIMIIDDPIKNRQDADSSVYREMVWGWYRSTARTRLSPDGAIIVIMTRWHEDDLAGRLLQQDPEGWEVINLPAISVSDEPNRQIGEALWDGHYGLDKLEAIKRDVGSYEWSALYQQRPIDDESREFKKDWIREIDEESLYAMETARYMSVDTAISATEGADNTGIVINFVNNANKWHLISHRLKINATELISLLFTFYQKYHLDGIGIEKTIYLQAIKPFLDEEQRRRNIFLPIMELEHKGVNKNVRIRMLIPRYETGSVYHVKGQCAELEDEMLSFPKGIHDDVIDACAYLTQMSEPPATGTDFRILHNRQTQVSFK